MVPGGLSGRLLLECFGNHRERFDCPRLDTLFLAFPVSFRGRLIQHIERIPREIDCKTEAVLYDYFDERSPVLKKFSVKRLKTYKVVGVT
jgi:superfamily II DNA or RNA helicase